MDADAETPSLKKPRKERKDSAKKRRAKENITKRWGHKRKEEEGNIQQELSIIEEDPIPGAAASSIMAPDSNSGGDSDGFDMDQSLPLLEMDDSDDEDYFPTPLKHVQKKERTIGRCLFIVIMILMPIACCLWVPTWASLLFPLRFGEDKQDVVWISKDMA